MDFRQIAKALIPVAFESTKQEFRVRPAQVSAITRQIRRLGHDATYEFPTPKARDAFLYAALRYLDPLPHEELLVAVGARRGSARAAGAALRRMHRVVGDVASVTLTQSVIDLVASAVDTPGGEIVLVHNHPSCLEKSIIRNVIGWTPIPSDQDRRLAAALLTPRLRGMLTSARPASLKWYLVDEGEMAEFLLPAIDDIELVAERAIADFTREH